LSKLEVVKKKKKLQIKKIKWTEDFIWPMAELRKLF